MKISSLQLVMDRPAGKLISPRSYHFTEKELATFDTQSIMQHEHVVLADIERPWIEPASVRGLALEFARLKTDQDINDFAHNYGLLGTGWYEPLGKWRYHYEPASEWRYHSEFLRKLFLIYRALTKLKKGYDAEIEGKILTVQRSRIVMGYFEVLWYDGTPTGLVTRDDPGIDYTITARNILISALRDNLEGGVNNDFSKVMLAEDTSTGFRIVEQRTTFQLIKAIYYDLWETITDSRQIYSCKACGLPIEKSGRRKYCSDGCKQVTYRKNKKKKEELANGR